MTTSHPPPEDLTAFGHGRLSATAAAAVEDHLGECDTCRDALTLLPDDDLVKLVRRSAPRPVAATAAGRAEYRNLTFHARGGLGEVARAWADDLGREVAIKRLLPSAEADPACRRRFEREAEIAARLEHPGIVPVYGRAADDSGRPAYVMRFVRGRTLREAVREYHARPADAVAFRGLLTRFTVVCSAVAYAHSRGIVHRDIKPANVLLGEFGETLLLDWGLAKELATGPREQAVGEPGTVSALDATDEDQTGPWREDARDDHTAAGTVLGTPGYMAPEQAAGKPVGPPADVYALGATLYTLLTDATPGKPGQPAPAALLAVARKAMADQPADRYETPLALTADVDRFLAGEPVSAHRDGPLARGRRWVRHHSVTTAAVLVGLVVTAVGSVVAAGVVFREQQKTSQALAERTVALDDARDNFALAREAIDRYVTRVGKERALKRPGLDALRADLLADARGFYDKLAARPAADAATEVERALAYSRLSKLMADTGDREQAAVLCRGAIARVEPLAAAHPDRADLRRALVRLLIDLTNHHANDYQFDAADETVSRAVALADKLAAENPTTSEDHQWLAMARQNQAILHAIAAKLGHPERAADAVRSFAAARTAASAARATDPSDLEAVRVEFGVLTGMGTPLRQSDPTAAAEVYQAALAAADVLTDRPNPDPDDRYDRSRTQTYLGKLLSGKQETAKAVTLISQAIATNDELTRDHPRNLLYPAAAANARNTLGEVYAAAGRTADAARVWQETLAVFGPAAARLPERFDVNFSVAEAATYLGETAAAGNDPTAALRWFDRAVEVVERPALRNKAGENVAAAHAGRATALSELKRPTESAAAWDRAVEAAPPASRPMYLARRARQSLATGDVGAALAIADGVQPTQPAVMVVLARVYAVASAVPGTPPAERDARAALCIHWLTRAAADRADLANPDFAAVRDRPDFPRPPE